MSNLSVAAYRDWANAPSNPESAVIQAAINAAEEAANAFCAREFVVAADTATARVFVPGGGSILRIDDCTDVTAVTDNGSSVAASAYQLEPLNSRNVAGLTVPYEQIVKLSGGYWVCDFGRATVSVTAKWGWSALPDVYYEAVKMLTKDLIDSASMAGGVVGLGVDGVVRLRQNTYVAMLLSPLRRVESWGIA